MLAEGLSLPIVLAGDYLATPTLEGAVASGEAAAGRLAVWLLGS
jgi:predicted NAD/FAD-dependent oxidoreductase